MNTLDQIITDPFDMYPNQQPSLFSDELFAEFVAEWEEANREFAAQVEYYSRQTVANICPLDVDDLSEAAAWVAAINAVMPESERFDDDVRLIKLASEVAK